MVQGKCADLLSVVYTQMVMMDSVEEGAAQLLCASVGSYTAEYRDDTDNQGGGCRMSWMLSVPTDAPEWLRSVQLCYVWYPDGDGGQCGAGEGRELCAYSYHWTTYYRDDTDN